MTHLRKMMLEELQRRNYSKNTAEAYIRALRDFAAFYHQPPDRLGPDQIRQYQLHLMKERKQTWTPTASSKAWNYHGKGILKQWVSRSFHNQIFGCSIHAFFENSSAARVLGPLSFVSES